MTSPRYYRHALIATLIVAHCAATLAADAHPSANAIIVTSTFRSKPIAEVPASVSVLDADTVQDRQAQHLEDVLNAAPNVNFASGASRGRFIQLRGIGERSEFTDPINPSVGLVIDDIDFSQIGAAATLFDVRQVEILRGPQGTRFGANALAGIVNITSNDPTAEFGGSVAGDVGNYATRSGGGVLNGALTENLLGRIAVQQYRSDGFIDNDFLHRDNSNNRDEFTGRGKLRWLASEDLTIDLTAFYANIDNGYDAFSLDNTRHTLSDQPGQDRQETTAFALKATWTGSDTVTLQTIATHSDSNLAYGYDEDWSFNGLCTGAPCAGQEYSSAANFLRDRAGRRLELRLLSTEQSLLFGNTEWVAGVFLDHTDTALDQRFFDFALNQPNARFASDYETDNRALYGQLTTHVSERLVLTMGGRWERFDADYRDSLNIAATPDEDLWGGQLSLQYLLDANTQVYALVSRGYRPGGVNGEALGRAEKSNLDLDIRAFLTQRLEFTTETLVNWEVGLRGSYFDQRLLTRLSLFYMDRNDVQLQSWYNKGPFFIGYTDNAASGKNYGAELETQWQINDRIRLFANLGWLETEIDNFLVNDPALGLVDKSGREQAQAPRYQFNVGSQARLGGGYYARVEVEGKDNFYFSDSDDEESWGYALVNARLGYRARQWDFALWGRNLTDRDYAVRGFFFGNDPRKFYANEPYYQFGEPRVIGATAKYSF